MPNINSDLVKTLAPPSKGNHITYDSKQRGFGIRVTALGARSFVLNYTVHGRERRYTIGSFPERSLAAARERAKELRRLIDTGGDPLQEKREDCAAPTVDDLWEIYRTEHLHRLSQRSHKDVASIWEKKILPHLGGKKLRDLSSSDIDRLHRSISVKTPVRANRTIEVLRKALNIAKRKGYIALNVANGYQRNAEPARQRYLNADELSRLGVAIAELENPAAAAALRLLVLTGARLREVLGAEWGHFDLDRKVWSKPGATTKQRRDHVIPISEAVVTLLGTLPRGDGARYLFPTRTGTPLADLNRPWRRVVKSAGLYNLRLYDLRHTYASHLVSAGETLAVIGALLGHTHPSTTNRYAHLLDHPLRLATNRLAELVGNVVPSDK